MSGNTYEHGRMGPPNLHSDIRLTHLNYALQALSFIFAVTYLVAIIALVINYVKYDEVKNTWIETHFRWQINTFWLGVLGYIIGLITVFILIGWIILLVTYIWLIYRVVKGWIYLNDKRPLYS